MHCGCCKKRGFGQGLKKGLDRLFYALLLVGGLFFSKGVVLQYLEGRTTFDISYQPLSLHEDDLPVFILSSEDKCWEPLSQKIRFKAMLNGKSKTFIFNSSVTSYEDMISLERVCAYDSVTSANNKIVLGKNFGNMLSTESAKVTLVVFTIEIFDTEVTKDLVKQVYIAIASKANSYVTEMPMSGINKDGLLPSEILYPNDR